MALCLSFSALAQSSGLGITAGFTSSQLKLKDLDVKSASGFNAGLMYRLPLVSGLVFQPGLTYNVKGSNWEDLKSQAKFGYVEIPLQLQWGLDLVMLRPYVFAEPFIGYAVSGKDVSNGSSINMGDIKNRFEYGFGVGGGIDLFDCVQVSAKYFWNFEDCALDSYIGRISRAIKERSSFDGIMVSVALFF